jgi:hypothetical protein
MCSIRGESGHNRQHATPSLPFPALQRISNGKRRWQRRFFRIVGSRDSSRHADIAVLIRVSERIGDVPHRSDSSGDYKGRRSSRLLQTARSVSYGRNIR